MVDGRHHDATVDGQHDHDGRAGHGEHERHGFQHLDIFAVEAAIEVVDEAREDELLARHLLEVLKEFEEGLEFLFHVVHESELVLQPRAGLLEDDVAAARARLAAREPHHVHGPRSRRADGEQSDDEAARRGHAGADGGEDGGGAHDLAHDEQQHQHHEEHERRREAAQGTAAAVP